MATPSRKKKTSGAEKIARQSAKPKRGRSAVEALTALDRERQQTLQSAAKEERIKRTGVTSRVRGHVSARGKRSQARRDSKNS